jgi:hypothetical protein
MAWSGAVAGWPVSYVRGDDMSHFLAVLAHAAFVYIALLFEVYPAAALNAILSLYWIAKEVKG